MTTPITDLVRDAAGHADRLGAGMDVAGRIGDEWFTGGAGAVQRPGSITKVVTATAMMQLVDEGLVSLDDPVNRWVPWVRDDVQVHHLLSHSSGIDATDVFIDAGDDDDAIARYLELDEVKGAGHVFEPGEACSYNNAGMVMVGHIVSLVRGTTYEEAAQRHVLDRAGMEGASFELARNGNPICSRGLAPAGSSLQCTATDLVRLASSTELVRAETATLMRTLRVEAPGGVRQNCGFGLGWQVWRNEHGETARHAGAFPGSNAVVVHDVARDAVIAFMSPFGNGLQGVNPLLDPRGAVVTDEQPPSLDVYAGEYVSQMASVTIARAEEGDGLTLQLGSFPPMPIELVDRGTFTLVGEPFGFFGFGDDGTPRFMRFRMRVQRKVR
ncbi:MAG TPA: serine hydrolase domain-containing protein [Acidimicrobiales bacterium]|nr:serine hydrolase domain-containing protein [Acidimicrobiales bacterium]